MGSLRKWLMTTSRDRLYITLILNSFKINIGNCSNKIILFKRSEQLIL